MSLKGILIGSAGVIGLLVFMGVSNRGGTASVSGPQGASGVQSTSGSSLALAPDFELERMDGGTISLSEFRGKKAVVLDFWASWCPNCRRDMPNLQKFYEKYKDEIEVIAVNLQEKESKAREFIESNGFTFPVAFDPSSQAARLYQIQYTNTHFLIDKEGNLVQPVVGDINEGHFKLLLES